MAGLRRVLVTGGGRRGRFGALVCSHLAANGWHVAIHCNTSSADAHRLASEIGSAGGKAGVVEMDFNDSDKCDNLIAEAATLLGGPLDALVNNAAIFQYDSASRISPELMESHWRINLMAPMLLASAFSRQAIPERDPCIVQMLDQRVVNPNQDFISYTASKAALSGMIAPLAMAFAGRCRVNAVAPGALYPSHKQGESEFAAMADVNLSGRPIKVDEVAASVAFLLGTTAINGETLYVANGQQWVGRLRDPIVAP
jgi:NAD(P)-dependent dehydrogenase (short-subunit alcohol dehydrogenase family)